MAKIGVLPANPVGAAIYRRKDGSTYMRLNDEFHVKVKIGIYPGDAEESWLGDGCAEKIDPEEEVEIIQTK